MKNPCILIYSPLPGEAEEYFNFVRSALPDVDVYRASNLSEAQRALDTATILTGRQFPAELLYRAQNLRWIHQISAGVEDVIPFVSQRSDVLLTRSDGALIAPRMVEYVLGSIYALTQRFPSAWQQARRRQWQTYRGDKAAGKTVGLAGLGDIGSKIAHALSANGMQVIGWRRSNLTCPPGVSRVYRGADEFPAFAARCDFLVSVLPNTPETTHVFDRSAFKAMKKTAFLINIGRGSSVDETALAEAIAGGEIAGAFLDVFEQEPLPPDSPLWNLPNVIVTPHMSGPLVLEDLAPSFIENFHAFMAGLEPQRRVPPERGY